MAERHPTHKTISRELPPDILFFNLLPRLPAKSLLRFRYVCKQWHSFLTSPEFLNIHLHHVTNDDRQNHQKTIALSTTTPCKFHTIDCESPKNGLSVSRSLPFEVSPENMKFVTSFHGLVCVGLTERRYDHKYSDLILWNPLTGEYKRLSKSKECYQVNGRAWGLYYSSNNEDYKLLCATYDQNAYIYSLKSDSWRKIDSTEGLKVICNLIFESWEPSIVQDEKLFFLKKCYYTRGGFGQLSYSIVSFDTKTEKFTEIATPGFEARLNFTLLQNDHRIYACGICKENSTEVGAMWWRMDGEGDWTKVVTCPISPSLDCFQKPLHLMRNGNWLTYCLHSGCHLYELDLVRHIAKVSYSNTAHSMVIPPGGKYIETLVSPNR